MNCIQKEIIISKKKRGFHSITDEVISQFPDLENIQNGICQIFIKHTSASLTINEDADPTVLLDFESHFNKIVPEDQSYYKHTFEGSDDMPAHLKSSLLGSSVNIPLTNGKLNLGSWQGVYLCEHRNHAGPRSLVITIWGT
jgi:secondary thiamine-phosphate synthase enzyme